MSEISTVTPQESTENIESQDIQVFASQAGISLVGKVGGRVLNLIGEVVIARALGPALFGAYAIGITVLRLVGIVGPLGLHNGVIWFGAPYWKRDASRLKGVLFRSLIIGSISGLLIGIFIFFAAPAIAEFYNEPELVPVLRWFAPAYLFITLLRIASSATRVTLKTKYSVFAEDIFQPLAFITLLIVFMLVSSNYIGALAATTLSFAGGVSLAIYYVYKLFFYNKLDRIIYPVRTQELLRYSLPTALTGFLGTANIWIDRFLVKLYRPTADVGIYQAASQSSMLFAIILNAINSIFGPMIADYYQNDQLDKLQTMYRVSTKWGLYSGLPFFLVIFIAPQLIITTIFGPNYSSGALPMIVLNIGQLVNLATGSVGYLLIMTSHQNLWLILTAISLGLNILLNSLLTPMFGLLGAAISTSISVSFLFIAALIFVKRILNLWPFDRRYLKGILACVPVALFVTFILSISFQNAWLELILVLVGAYLIFLVLLVILGLDTEDKELIQLLKKKVF